MRRHLTHWGAVYVLVLLFLGSWAGQYVSQVLVEGEEFSAFVASTFENWQSEFLQLAVQCLIVQSLWAGRHLFAAEGSASKDDIESLRREIKAIRR